MRQKTKETMMEMERLYRELGSVLAVAERLGYRPLTVQVYLRNMGVVGRSIGVIHYAPTACEKNRELLLKMLDAGAKLTEIAKAVGTGSGRVKEFLRSIGRDKKFPRLFAGSLNPHWKGGRLVDKSGYVLVHVPDHPHCNRHGYVREHRLVMEQKLGRRLKKSEVVHHRDKNKSNNSPDNLDLFEKNSIHLAHELKGKVPKWTTEGWKRMQQGAARGREILRKQILARSKPSASV